MSSFYLGAWEVPNGYFGERAVAHFIYFEGRIYSATPDGYRSEDVLGRCYLSLFEAQWYLDNHYLSKKHYRFLHP